MALSGARVIMETNPTSGEVRYRVGGVVGCYLLVGLLTLTEKGISVKVRDQVLNLPVEDLLIKVNADMAVGGIFSLRKDKRGVLWLNLLESELGGDQSAENGLL